MSESVIADFVATFNSEATARSDPVKGRVLLSEKRLVLAADEGKVTIPLSAVFDVAVGHVPEDLGDFFRSTVTVAFERGDTRMVAAIETDDDKIGKFCTVFFKALLNSTDMTVKHPARVGGRVSDAEFAPAKLFLEPGTVTFRRSDDTVAVELATVSDFDRLTRGVGGRDRAVLAVKHMQGTQSMVTLAATTSARKMSILGRYLRLEYSDLVSDLEDVDLSEEMVETLVTIYSSNGDVSLASILDVEASQVTMLLNDLESDDLVVTTDDGPQLTPKGRIVVSHQLEAVNA